MTDHIALSDARFTMDAAGDLAHPLNVLASAPRLRILSLLIQRGEMRVLDLVEEMPITQPTVSHHVGLLAEAGLVSRRKEGVFAYYKADRKALRALAAAIRPAAAR